MPTVFERVKVIVVDKLGADDTDVEESSSFVDDLNADSLDLVELIMAFEEEFSTEESPLEIPDEDAGSIATVADAVAYLKGRSDVTGRVGAMGWCFGGGVALSFGLDGDNHEATAIFYGRLVDDPEVVARLDHEVYGTFAALDQGPSPESVAAFEAALLAAGIENDLHIYDDVGHGFWLRVDEDPEVRTAPAEDAWQRLKAYLERTLGS